MGLFAKGIDLLLDNDGYSKLGVLRLLTYY